MADLALGRVFDIIALMITVVFVTGLLISFVYPERRVDAGIYAIITAIISAYGAARIVQKNGDKK